ncbi:Transcription-repair-coupling factor [Polystyrenella longa]|uniref:Transcription-repair-coupling factor n=1 Tax=Polystyrenella longa TaxID=2528007 RepID=A0A518CR24_9PLAN|nr:DEAD/DEAH box helicase [Polystyrenella longa]QDU81660.1 Transcription-repair-coupling factor [Polystyrenella longa]
MSEFNAPDPTVSRDELCSEYLDLLPFEPYPVQEEALLAWFSTKTGVLVCAPTGTGKTLIAEAAIYEALRTGTTTYYTTPLIALTDQKFRELQEKAALWGFDPNDVGLVTGNRSVNPNAKVLVVVAEILLNRLLHTEAFDFKDVSSVVMDEFHNFADRERGIVWELSLTLLPKHIRLMLLSATVGNTAEFLNWLTLSHGRRLQLVQSFERKVPLRYEWVEDQLLSEQLELMTDGDEADRKTPALVFCFNREQCWSVAEHLKGKHLVDKPTRERLNQELEKHDFSHGAGPKIKQILLRGVGVHHAGVLPSFRRIVEDLFQQKLLSVCVCTETLAAGINLPARSVVLTELLKGPPKKKKLMEASGAHQMFGRAGRPQFDTQGYVFALAHEDDVKISRWKVKYDQIPEDTKDPLLIKAKKKMKKKAPTRRSTFQYWSEAQFETLQTSPPGKLYSNGPLPWRLLAYLLTISPDVSRIREFIALRLMEPKQRELAEKELTQMLISLEIGEYVKLDPPPPKPKTEEEKQEEEPAKKPQGTFGALLMEAREDAGTGEAKQKKKKTEDVPEREIYAPQYAHPQSKMHQLLKFRSVNPLYGVFLTEVLAQAEPEERIQAFESVLEMPGSVARNVRVPYPEVMPPGNLAREFLDQEVIRRGLAAHDELYPSRDDDIPFEERRWPIPFADKLRMLFHSDFPRVRDFRITPVWCAGDFLTFNADFNKYVSGRDLVKQEGIIFKHLLRLILLLEEFEQVTPPGLTDGEWKDQLREMGETLTRGCRDIDPTSTNEMLESAHLRQEMII